jgi:hypothetical protein
LNKQALLAIDRCPLLSNLAIDTQWNIHYRSKLGRLKVFLARHYHRYSSLELDHRTLIKLSSTSTIDQFRNALYRHDPMETSGHFVSILVQSNSYNHAPLSLFATILQTFYAEQTFDKYVYEFLVRLFIRIPLLILIVSVQRVFLEPLIKLEGSQRQVRDKLWKVIEQQDIDIVRQLTVVGEQLGFTEWSMTRIDMTTSIVSDHRRALSSSTSIVSTLMSTSRTVPITSNTQSRPFDVIERIRREKFGIGLHLSDESQQLTEQLKLLIGRSLERLSKELYNSDMHFVLELIQNADDNQYEQSPALIFIVDVDGIEIYNNEIGFEEHHIHALCDIGKSTKGKHQQGYIGQKGRRYT